MISKTPADLHDVYDGENGKQEHYGDWRDEFFENGWAVVKGAIPDDRAAYYRDSAIKWLQSFNLGFDPKDRSTWTKDRLPEAFKGGMFLNYSVTHEKFMWEARWYV